ncbi:MAG: hypothetical protein IKR50_01290 [Prevotella sp.]|nr:hypothetical protein [Prevotella sp.]
MTKLTLQAAMASTVVYASELLRPASGSFAFKVSFQKVRPFALKGSSFCLERFVLFALKGSSFFPYTSRQLGLRNGGQSANAR